MRPAYLFLTTVLLALPLFTEAKQVTSWDLTQPSAREWSFYNLSTVTPDRNGLHIKTDTDGFLVTNVFWKNRVDAVRLTLTTEHPMEAVILWRDPIIAPQGYIQLPFLIPETGSSTIDIDVRASQHWNDWTPLFGLAFPAGSSLTLERIEFLHWNPSEKFWNGLLSFWTFDTFNIHSINFLWGPWITTNPVARASMHESDPPSGHSGAPVFYALLLLTALIGLWLYTHRGHRQILVILSITFAVLWVVFDMRMGGEILSYVRTDWQSFVLQPAGARSFRSMRSLHDTALTVAPLLRKQDSYIFVGPGASYYQSFMRYLTYPSIPVTPESSASGTTLALLLARDEAVVTKEGLWVGDILIPRSGKILRQFRDASYLIEFSP
ncbi:MAG: hypothetical protein WCX61_03775 [Candidatus Peribacteraceae bacterium]